MFRLTRYWRSRRGAVVYVTALMLPVLIGTGAVALDLGSIFLQSRKLQGDADLAALGAANNLSNAQAAANATAGANGWRYPVTAAVTLGVYTPNATVPASQRFVAGGTPSNAVKVTLTTQADLFFGASILGVSTVPISRTATAAIAQEASFSLGSGLASVNGGIENALLSALTGSTVSLNAVDYNSLASTNIDLLQYSNQLQTDLNLQGVSYNNVLSSQITTGQALKAMAEVLTANGSPLASNGDPLATDIDDLATAAGDATVPLNQLIDLGPYGNQDHDSGGAAAGIGVSALSMATAILQLSNGTRQVQFNLGATLPGVSSTTVYLATGQRMSSSPWITVTDANSVVLSTAQTRLYVDSQVTVPQTVTALTGLNVATVNLPVYVELASAEAKLSSLTCPTSATPESVSVEAAPSVGEVAIGQVDTTQLNNFTNELTISPATFVSVANVLSVTSGTGPLGPICLGGTCAGTPAGWLITPDWQTMLFSASQIQAGTSQTVSTTNVAQASITSLATNLNPTVNMLGLSLPLNPLVGPAVTSVLTPTIQGELDTALDSLEKQLGLQIGTATVVVNGVRCNDAALVA